MANSSHVEILKAGPNEWNEWRTANPDVRPDLAGSDFSRASLNGVNLSDANLRAAKFDRAMVCRADFTRADASGARFVGAVLRVSTFDHARLDRANLSNAKLDGSKFRHAGFQRATLKYASLRRCNLSNALLEDTSLREATVIESKLVGTTLRRVDLSHAVFNDVVLEGAELSHVRVYGISAWRPIIDAGTRQSDLIVSPDGEPEVRIDDLALAQLVDLIVRSADVRSVIHEFGRRAVLIVGRFSDDGFERIEAIRQTLKTLGLAPIVFDFPPLGNQTRTETVRVLAHLSRFIIADVTDPRCVPQELMAIIPHLPSVPVLPILQEDAPLWPMAESLAPYPWFLSILKFRDSEQLASLLPGGIADGPEAWLRQAAK